MKYYVLIILTIFSSSLLCMGDPNNKKQKNPFFFLSEQLPQEIQKEIAQFAIQTEIDEVIGFSYSLKKKF